MKTLSWISWSAATLLCVYVAGNALHYLQPNFPGPEFILQNRMANPWLVLHAVVASVALLIGPIQLLPGIRTRAPWLHRWLGRGYMAACIAAGVSGLILAAGTTAGLAAGVGFAALGVLLLVCVAQAWRLAVARRFEAHRAWVIRSYALIFAGVTLRLWIPLSFVAQLDFMESYRVIAFLAWVPNLLLAELYLALTRRRAGRLKTA